MIGAVSLLHRWIVLKGLVQGSKAANTGGSHDLSIEEVLLLNGSRMHGVENLLCLPTMCEATVVQSLHDRCPSHA